MGSIAYNLIKQFLTLVQKTDSLFRKCISAKCMSDPWSEMEMLAEKGGWQVEKLLQIDDQSQYVGILKKS